MLREYFINRRIESCWQIHLPPNTNFVRQVYESHLPRYLLTFVVSYTVQYLLWIVSWLILGRGVFQNHLDNGWLLAWALILLTIVPFHLILTRSEGLLTIGFGGLLKQRFLYRVTRLATEDVRHQGVGQLLGRVLDSEALESLALNGGLHTILAGIEIIVAATILGIGAGSTYHTLLLLGWTGLAAFMGWRYLQTRRDWTEARLDMTHEIPSVLR